MVQRPSLGAPEGRQGRVGPGAGGWTGLPGFAGAAAGTRAGKVTAGLGVVAPCRESAGCAADGAGIVLTYWAVEAAALLRDQAR